MKKNITQKENIMTLPHIVASGIYDSRIAAKNILVSKDRKTTKFEIELPLEKGGVSFIDAACAPVSPDIMICARPHQTRHTKFPLKSYYLHMIVPEGPLYEVLMNTENFFLPSKPDKYREIFEEIIEHSHLNVPADEIRLQSLVLELIYMISKDSPYNANHSSSGAAQFVINRTIQYIQEHLTEDLSLEKLAKEMSFSPVYFHKTFKAVVNKTLRDYIEEQRIKKAIHLLQTTDDSLTKIAYECGFSSQSYFSFVFKRRMNQTPRKYIEELHKKYEL